VKISRTARVATLAGLALIVGAIGFVLLRDDSPEAVVAERLRAALTAKDISRWTRPAFRTSSSTASAGRTETANPWLRISQSH
jgi:hypothetical protein